MLLVERFFSSIIRDFIDCVSTRPYERLDLKLLFDLLLMSSLSHFETTSSSALLERLSLARIYFDGV